MTPPAGYSNPPSGPRPPGPPQAAAPALRAIIWHSATAELPSELLSSLSKRIGRMIICTDAYSALAEACLIERQRRLDLADSSPAPAGGVLVLVHPAHLTGVHDVAESLGSYAPSVTLWVYDRGANPKLRAVVQGDVTLAPPTPSAPPVPPSPAPRGAAPVRPAARPPSPAPKTLNGTAGSHAAPPAPQPVHQPAPARRGMLTEDELAMLLTPEPQPQPDPQHQPFRYPRPAGPGGGRAS